MMKLYISGPMTGMPDFNHPAFMDAELRLEKAGYIAVNPAGHNFPEGTAWTTYLRLDLMLLLGCDGVALLPNWVHSRGSRLEVHVATELGIPCLSVEEWLAARGAISDEGREKSLEYGG